MLVGRTTECTRIDRLLERARRGQADTLVLRGEAGIGKSALLQYATERTAGMRTLATRGVESESELAFAGLADLLRPLLHGLPALPSKQAAALRGALALGPAAPGERFAVYAATLSLLGISAESTPLALLIDDAHWLDVPSAEALAFTARRLDAERVAILFAVREGEAATFVAQDLEELHIGGLANHSARSLLVAHAPHPPSAAVAKRLVEETGGNPLALIELAALLTDRQLAGEEPLEAPIPVGARVERAFLRRIDTHGDAVRRALLVAAAAAAAPLELSPILDAAASLGVDAVAFDRAEAAGLVAVQEGRVVFRHPLVRSAIYSASPPAERRAAHRALAKVLTGERLADVRAWHLAAAAFEPNEEVADALERAAEAAQRRNGYAAATRALEQAARLSSDDEARARRLFGAADAARLAGQDGKAASLLAEAVPYTTDPQLRARMQNLRGRIEMFRGRARTAHSLLTRAAADTAPLEPELAATMLAEAAIAAFLAGEAPTALATALRARDALPTEGGLAELITALTLGTALYRMGDATSGVPLLVRAAAIAEQEHQEPLPPEYVLFAALVFVWAMEHARARRLVQRVLGETRDASALGVLPLALYVLSMLEIRTGHWPSAYATPPRGHSSEPKPGTSSGAASLLAV